MPTPAIAHNGEALRIKWHNLRPCGYYTAPAWLRARTFMDNLFKQTQKAPHRWDNTDHRRGAFFF